jgi:hypothetical protein
MCERKSVEREISVKNAAETIKKSAGVMLSFAWLLFSRAQRPYLSKDSLTCLVVFFEMMCQICEVNCTPFTRVNRTRAPRKCLKLSNSGDFR